jgi:beta-glucanase (GH16 family)
LRLLWADECSGKAGAPPDAELWVWRPMDAWHPPDELQTYTDDAANAHYDGRGHLVITARKGPGPRRYTSARLSAHLSSRPGLFLYGCFQARIRVPTGFGIWPAFWLLGQDDVYGWPLCGEIDVMEAPSSATTVNQVHQGTHSPSAYDGGSVAVGIPPALAEWGRGFHTFAADWGPGEIRFLIDERMTGVVTRDDVELHGGTWVFDERPQAPVLNIAVGGWAGPPDGSWAEQSMVVDWVRVYQTS